MTIGIWEPNHLDNDLIQARLACLILQSVQILNSFGFQPHKAIVGSQGVLQSPTRGSFDYRKEVPE